MRTTISQAINNIRTLRNEVPEWKENSVENKEAIESFHIRLDGYLMAIKQEVGFESMEQTIKFVDQEIQNLASAELLS